MSRLANAMYLFRSLLRRGPAFLWLYFKESLLFDLVNGTNTHLRVPKPESDEGSAPERDDGLLYVASLTRVVRDTLDAAKEYMGGVRFESAQFLDLGCGKGKALLVYAMEYAIESGRTAIGLEYDAPLCEIAASNLRRVGAADGRAEVYCASALSLARYAGEGPLIAYLYNSFQGETLQSALEILAGYEHLLIYVDPVERDILSRYGYTMIAERHGRYNADTWLVAAGRRMRKP